jgi:hypothetical protein
MQQILLFMSPIGEEIAFLTTVDGFTLMYQVKRAFGYIGRMTRAMVEQGTDTYI